MSQIEELQRFVDECYKEEDQKQIEESPPLESQLSAKKRSLHKSSQEEEAASKVQRVEADSAEEPEEVRKPRLRRLVMSDSSD